MRRREQSPTEKEGKRDSSMRGLLTAILEESKTIYFLENKNTGATMECTEKYLTQWLARGFEVVEIRLGGQIA
jgi:hypothetical protein